MPVSEARKASMKKYNQSISLESKRQYAMTRLFVRLKSGTQKVIQKNTLTKFPWTEAEKEYLKNFLPSDSMRARQRLIEPEPEIDFETLLHCSKVKEYLDTRTNYTPSRLSSGQIRDKTMENDASQVSVLCRIFNTEDFRKIFDETPNNLLSKLKSYVIPKGYKNAGSTYKDSSLKSKIKILFVLMKEYPPASEYIKQKTNHDFKQYYTDLERISSDLQQSSETSTIQKAEANLTNQDDILHNLKELFRLVSILDKKKNHSMSDNLNHLLSLFYTYGTFKKTIDPDNVALIPRLALDKIKIETQKNAVFQGDGKYYNSSTGRLYLKGRDSGKQGGLYEYNFIMTKFVKDEIKRSLQLFPRDYLFGTYTSATIGRNISKLINKHLETKLVKTNTDIRHLYETVYKILKVNGNTLSNAMGHSPMMGKSTYKQSLIDEYDDDKRQLIVDFFKSLSK